MRHFYPHFVLICALFFSSLVAAADPFEIAIPNGLPKFRIPRKNPPTLGKIALGKQLYFDPRLSGDNTVSCASCHDPQKGWSNGEAFATGVRGQVGGRSAPTIVNAAYHSRATFWDGRAAQTGRTANDALEVQALGPIENPIEMDMALPDLVEKLGKIEGYKTQFEQVFGTEVTAIGIGQAIASFERTILSGNAPIDRYLAGDKEALSAAAERGLKLFNTKKTNCSACHKHPLYMDEGFHNIGVGMEKAEPDLGRYAVTKQEGDKGRFKTTTLREIARTAPYMHDGRFKTLEEVVEFYVKGGVKKGNPTLDEEIFPLKLTDQEKADLVVFMKEALSSPDYPNVEPPVLPE